MSAAVKLYPGWIQKKGADLTGKVTEAPSPNSSITLNTLCQVTQVSARTLQHAFLEHFGLSPKAYLRVQRLNDAHRELFASNPHDARVAEIAHRQGFWHMGQFASDYKQLFGELPSNTLRKTYNQFS
jgi:AraC family ethanolamine operon transcriptional activator